MKKTAPLFLILIIAFWWTNQEPKTIQPDLEAKRLIHQKKKGGLFTGPYQAAEHWRKRTETDGKNPHQLNRAAIKNAKKSAVNPDPQFAFEELGPGNFAGRVRSIILNPLNPDQMLIGSVSGGIWKSTNGGQTWEPKADFLPNIAISCMVMDPANPQRIFAGTGEGFFNADAARGNGIFVTEDFGETWTQLTSTLNSEFYFVNRLAMIPNNSVLLAATWVGIFRSTDLGQTWTRTDSEFVNGRGYMDIKVDPSSSNRVFATLYGSATNTRKLIRSEDGGQTFGEINIDLPTNRGRMEIGIGSDGIAYLSVSDDSGGHIGLFRSADHGNTWTKSTSTTEYIERQGWYDLAIAVSPHDSNRIILGVVDLFRSEDGGNTIGRISNWAPPPGGMPQYVHADIHNITFHPTDPNSFFVTCDGGIFKTLDGGNTFIELNNNLRITQYYGFAVEPGGERVIGGTQDNGTHLFFGDRVSWLQWFGGDGGFCAWDQQDPNYVYGSTPSGGMFGSNNGGLLSESLNFDDEGNAPFIQPFVLDPNDGNRMLVGSNRLWLSENVRELGNSTWIDASGVVSAPPSAMAFNPIDGSTVMFGLENGTLRTLTDLGGTNISAATGTQAVIGSVTTSITFDPNDASGQSVIATFGSYRTNRIHHTSDFGQSWRSLAGNLPAIPIYCTALDPQNEKRLFIGTELGVWVTQDYTQADPLWEVYEEGPAFTRIVGLEFGDEHTLYIATHGRGVYKASRFPISIPDITFVDVDGDGDGFLDAGETASLLIEVQDLGNSENVNIEVLTNQPEISVTSQPLSLQAKHYQTAAKLVAGNITSINEVQVEVKVTLDGSSKVFSFNLPVNQNTNLQSGTFFDGGEGENLMAHFITLGDEDWRTVGDQTRSGSSAWFSPDIEYYSENSLISPWLHMNSDSKLSFWIYYDMEGNQLQFWDGAVLEARSHDGDWEDLEAHIQGASYDGPLYNNSTLSRRNVWSGTQRTWREVRVDLGSLFANQTIQFRIRLACDTASANSNGGVWVDDIQVTSTSWESAGLVDNQTCDCRGDQDSSLANRIYLSEIQADDESDTSIGVINANPDPNSVELRAFGSNGAMIGKTQFTVEAMGKKSLSISDSFGLAKYGVSWVQVASEKPCKAYAEFINPERRSSYPATLPENTVFLPHIAKNTTVFSTFLSSVNTANGSGQTALEAQPGSQSASIDHQTSYSHESQNLQDYLGTDLTPYDWVTVNSDQPVSAMEYFVVNPDFHQMASLGLNGNKAQTLNFLHIATDTGQFWTGMVYINTGSSAATITETYYGSDGAVLSTRNHGLEPSAKETLLFDHSGSEIIPTGAAWLQVQSDQDLIGYELFGSSVLSANDFFAGFQANTSGNSTLIFPHVEPVGNQFTALVVLNLGDTNQNVTFEAYSASGQLLEAVAENNIGPKTKKSLVLSQVFSPSNLANSAWVRVVSDSNQFAGFQIWGDLTAGKRKHLSGLTAE